MIASHFRCMLLILCLSIDSSRSTCPAVEVDSASNSAMSYCSNEGTVVRAALDDSQLLHEFYKHIGILSGFGASAGTGETLAAWAARVVRVAIELCAQENEERAIVRVASDPRSKARER